MASSIGSTSSLAARLLAGDRCNAFISLATAEQLDAQLAARGSGGALSGKLVGVKDNFCTHDFATTCASRMLDGFRPGYDATVVRLLREAGALIVGKTNLDEFAMGSSTQHSHHGGCRHPLDARLVPGGSSGGSACAVALGLCDVAIGSDTGGSVRQPAAYCGLVGVKPSYGLASRHGLIAFASSLDTPGVLARTVDDARSALAVIVQHDVHDPTSYPLPPDRRASWHNRVLTTTTNHSTLRIGIPQQLYEHAELSPLARRHWDETCERLAQRGATITPVQLPSSAYALAVYYVLASAEAASNLSRYDGVRYGHCSQDPRHAGSFEQYIVDNRTAGFGDEVKRRILLGTYVLSSQAYASHYVQAQRLRRLICHDFQRVFAADGVHAILTPTAPGPAFAAASVAAADCNPVDEYLTDTMTIPASLAGLPAVSVNVAHRPELPFGMQLVADRFDEPLLLDLADLLHRPYNFNDQFK